ncbi:NAD-dependent epimerase/dehydratase family protein, partial [Vibrio splendidus]
MILNSSKIIVFGANGLLGSSVSQAILEAGYELVAVDYNISGFLSKIDDKYHGSIVCETLDITNEESVHNFFISLDGYVSGAVNCTYPRNESYGA